MLRVQFVTFAVELDADDLTIREMEKKLGVTQGKGNGMIWLLALFIGHSFFFLFALLLYLAVSHCTVLCLTVSTPLPTCLSVCLPATFAPNTLCVSLQCRVSLPRTILCATCSSLQTPWSTTKTMMKRDKDKGTVAVMVMMIMMVMAMMVMMVDWKGWASVTWKACLVLTARLKGTKTTWMVMVMVMVVVILMERREKRKRGSNKGPRRQEQSEQSRATIAQLPTSLMVTVMMTNRLHPRRTFTGAQLAQGRASMCRQRFGRSCLQATAMQKMPGHLAAASAVFSTGLHRRSCGALCAVGWLCCWLLTHVSLLLVVVGCCCWLLLLLLLCSARAWLLAALG